MKLIRNSMTTPDGTELISKHRHDFNCHLDANGKTYCVDGGNEYIRRVGDAGDCEDTSLTTDDPHDVIRCAFEWTSYGIDGKGKPTVTLLKDLEPDHIEAIIETQTHLPQEHKDMFNTELEYRK